MKFTVYGIAQPAGSKRGFSNQKTGRVIITDANNKAKPWKAEVRTAAAEAAGRNGLVGLMDGPLELSLTFYVPRPKSHIGARGVRPSAPMFPTVKPDVLKLARAVEDACTGVVWRDDSQIVTELLSKRYGEPARCEISVWPTVYQSEEAA